MFTCSQFYNNPKSSFNNNNNNNNNPSLTTKSTLPYNNSNNMSENQRVRFEKYHEASLKRKQFQQELQRRHQLCADKERLCRERAEKHMALKKVEECNALRKFYEIKSAQLRRSSSRSSNSSLSSNSSMSSASSFSSMNNSKSSKPTMSSTVKTFQAAYKIHSFIKHHIEKRRTQKIISSLMKLRLIQNRLSLLKSIKLKCSLTFDLNTMNNQVLPISANNKVFLTYKDSILKILNQLNNEFNDDDLRDLSSLVKERKIFINNTVNNMLKDLENERDLQYKNFIKNIENRNR